MALVIGGRLTGTVFGLLGLLTGLTLASLRIPRLYPEVAIDRHTHLNL